MHPYRSLPYKHSQQITFYFTLRRERIRRDRPLNLLLGTSSFAKNLQPIQSYGYDHPPYLVRFPILQHPQVMSGHPGLPSARILLGQCSQTPHLELPTSFLLVIFHPLTSTQLLGYKFPHAHAVFKAKPNLFPPLKN